MSGFALSLMVLALALAVDRLVGDPPRLWSRVAHPVALMGKAVTWLDERFNKSGEDFERARRGGVLALALGILGVGAIGMALAVLFRRMPLGWVIEVGVVATFLAQKSLVDHVAAVAYALGSRGLDGGREAVAKIVGRDVSILDEPGVARAAIESAAENFSDGIVAPVFWYLLLGLPGLLVCKFVNTADSMIGNRSPRYIAFGWAAARLDDALNLVPARLSTALIALSAWLTGLDARTAAAVALRDAPRHKSPNAGWPEAAVAGALGIALGGPRRYGAEEVEGAWLNPGARTTADVRDIATALRLIDAAWALLVVLFALAATTALSF